MGTQTRLAAWFFFAKWRGLPVWSLEDAFIRSIKPGWDERPQGLLLDKAGIYYDKSRPSDLSARLLGNPKLDKRAIRDLIDAQIRAGISKYNSQARGGWPHWGYVLVVDQVRDDAAIRHGGAGEANFRAMLEAARSRFPDQKILIRGHPSGQGYFGPKDADERTSFSIEPANPWDILENAKAVFVVTSQLGFEAILAGHTPYIFGQPFYAGLGLSHDEYPSLEDQARAPLSVEELYHAAMIEFPRWFDAALRPANLEAAMQAITVRIRAHELAETPLVLKDMRAWKRPHLKRFFPNQTRKGGGPIIRWGERQAASEWVMEDGFLRSRGLGAKLVPPLSLIIDKKGIYFDPTRPSDLEDKILARTRMSMMEKRRADELRNQIVEKGVSKYNLANEEAALPSPPEGREVILVPGQVEDDRSVLLGANGDVKNTEALLKAVRRDNPDSYIIYKPHPDVVSGLRFGVLESRACDFIYDGAGLDALWGIADHVATLTSLTGFEALLRGKTVSCYGTPFYAGWGLTRDFAPATGRRAPASLEALIHAALIDYPLYYDPKLRRLTTPEIVVERLASGEVHHPLYLRILTRAQQWAYRVGEFVNAGLKTD